MQSGMEGVNFRIRAAAETLHDLGLHIGSVLDVGCRGCEAQEAIPTGLEYLGNDILQNDQGSVSFVGDALTTDFGRTFTCVLGLDILEHVDNPYSLMEKLISLTDRHLLVSLPNIYELTHKIDFVFRNTLGGKYRFGVENSMDRHRWVMSYDEIHRFFQSYAHRYDMSLSTRDILTGEHSRKLIVRGVARLLSVSGGKRTITRTVLGVFSKNR